MVIALLNADKNNKQLKAPQKHKEPIISFYQYMKKYQILPNKMFKIAIAQENRFQIAIAITNHNSPIKKISRRRSPDRRNSENYSQNRYSRSNCQNIQNRNDYSRSDWIRSNYSNYNETVHIQTLGIHSIPNIVRMFQKIVQMIEIETIQENKFEITRKIDHKTTPILGHIIIIIIIDPVITLEIDTTIIRTDQKFVPSHHIEIILNNQTNKVKTTEAVHENIK